MTEVPLTTRVPKELERELEGYMEVEHLERSAALRRLLYSSLQAWRETRALTLVREGKVSVSKGAEIAGIDLWMFLVKIKEHRIEWVDDSVVEKDLRDFV